MDKIEKAVYKKGRNHWYDSKGKLIINGNMAKETRKKVVNIIKKDKNKYMNKNIVQVNITFHKEDPIYMDLQAIVYTVTDVLGKISLQIRDDNNSIIQIKYSLSKIGCFKIKHMKKAAMLILSQKYKFDPLKLYSYSRIEKKL